MLILTSPVSIRVSSTKASGYLRPVERSIKAVSLGHSIMINILVRTTSWTEKTLIDSKRFSPSNATTSAARLRYYATQFRIVEVGTCYPRHRSEEFLKFLRKIDRETPQGLPLHLILDNYGTHNHPNVKKWLQRHPRFHLHYTPTSSSWLNLVERWFGEITRKRIRRGVFRSVPELIAAIDEFILVNSKKPKPFVWTKKVEDILEKISHCKAIIETLH
jgi:transposase